MKNTLNYLFITCLIFIFTCCQDKEESIKPSDISNISSYPLPGKVVLKWEIPADSNYLYVKVSYNDPALKKVATKNASIFTDSILIEGLFNKYGEYEFSLQTFSETNIGGPIHTIKTKCQKVPPVYLVSEEKTISLTVDMLDAKTLAGSAGSPSTLPALIDNDLNTIYHSQWNPATTMPQWIEITLKETIQAFKFQYWNRADNVNGKAQVIEILISKDGETWESFDIINSGLPIDKGSDYTSKFFIVVDDIKKIRLQVNSCANNNDKFFSWAELVITEGVLDSIDPEAD